ncbi:MAG: phosphatase PAP2 family protein [Rickettsiales bacterium]|jgi:membrane-associated phospholipid phosphatase|nr:phosphatase PAP2 family protein [Rickettsiales bacterium]
MFLNNNTFLWKRWFVALGVTAALVLLGVFWFDAPLHSLFVRAPGWVGKSGELFGFEFWIAFAFVMILAMYIKHMGWKFPTLRRLREFLNILTPHRIAGDKSHGSATPPQGGSWPALVVLPSVVIAAVVTSPMKIIIGRMRPVFYDALNMTGFYPGSGDWAFHSMPSGHTAATFAALVALGLCIPKWKPYTWGLAILIAVSRICVGAHWPSDVIFGAFIGMTAADAAFSLVRKLVIKVLK